MAKEFLVPIRIYNKAGKLLGTRYRVFLPGELVPGAAITFLEYV